jgi:cytochrome c oxidase subunit 6b
LPPPLPQIQTAPIDYRFPTTNQARNCFVKYNEAHKCFAEHGGPEAAECARRARDYRSICPTEWLDKWNEAREAGHWYGRY